MEIRNINIRNIEVRDIRIPYWMTQEPSVPYAPPVTVQIGVPVIDIPGCVEAHEQNTNREKNGILNEDDPKGVRVFCDAGLPSFNPINFNEEVELPTPKPPIPPYKAPEVPEVPVIPKDIIPKVKEEIECPPPNAPRIGDVAQNQKERVSGFEVQNGVCVTLYEDIPWQAQYLPAPQVVATTGAIALTATTSALLAKPLADLLLKVFKPVIKKVITKISKIRGKKVRIESLKERRDLQRERSQAIRTLRRMGK